jgi:hypothetical protein
MFDKLKSLFIEEDENAKKATPKSSSQQNTPQPTPAKAAPKGMVTPKEDNYVPPTSGKPNEKFVNILMGALEKNNLQGFDYLEFKQALQNLGSVQMDEATRYKSAMAMAQTMGATPQILHSSADKYISVLKEEERKFLESFNKQQSARLNAQTSAIQSLEKSISDKTKRIEQLKTEIEAEKKSLESKKQTSNKAAAKVTATKDGFYIAYNIVVNQIKEDLVNIKKYL